jgi:predicted XRE-type DNA-binding protein
MAQLQTIPLGHNATTLALRAAVMRVVKQRKTHRNFLQASAETEARLLEGQPNSIFMYGL